MDVQTWEGRYARAAAQWRAAVLASDASTSSTVELWNADLAAMKSRQHRLVTQGRWRSGPRTLLEAIGLQHRELALSAGLAWLLRPDGHHGLGSGLIDWLLDSLGIEHTGAADVRIVREEDRDGTRADLVLYGADWTIVMELKVFAVEQPCQLDRLHHEWRDDPDPHFVFLTRNARTPTSAGTTGQHWSRITWGDVAAAVHAVHGTRAAVSPGVIDYVATLETCGHV